MDKIKKQLNIKKKFYFLFAFVIAIMMIITGCKSTDLHKRILDVCKSRDEIKLSEITDFSWDIAYIDRQYYGSGEELKEKYHVEGEFKFLETDFSSRVAFCKDGKLVYDLVLNNFYFEFDSSIETINPHSVLAVTWITIPEQKEEKLSLLPK